MEYLVWDNLCRVALVNSDQLPINAIIDEVVSRRFVTSRVRGIWSLDTREWIFNTLLPPQGEPSKAKGRAWQVEQAQQYALHQPRARLDADHRALVAGVAGTAWRLDLYLHTAQASETVWSSEAACFRQQRFWVEDIYSRCTSVLVCAPVHIPVAEMLPSSLTVTHCNVAHQDQDVWVKRNDIPRDMPPSEYFEKRNPPVVQLVDYWLT